MPTCYASGPSLPGDWATFANDVAHTGYFPGVVGNGQAVLAGSATLNTTNDLNQVATGQGRVYVTGVLYPRVNTIWARDEQTGNEIWTLTVNDAYSINPPTFQNGYVYIQRGNHASDSQLLCLNAGTGQVRWSAPFSCQWDNYYAPTVIDGRVWVTAGNYGGVQAFKQSDGTSLFFNAVEGWDEWTPTAYSGKIYSFTDGFVRQFGRGHTVDLQNNPEGWGEDWKLDLGWDWNGYTMDSVLAAADGRLYAVGNDYLASVSIAGKNAAWQKTGPFTYSPAIANGVVYGIYDKRTVRAYRASDGEFLGTFSAPTDLKWNLIVTDDVLICSSDTAAYIFNLQTYQLQQSLPHGGRPALANGALLLAGMDGVLRSYRFQGVEPQPSLVFTQYVNGMILEQPNRTRVVLRNNCGTPDTGQIRFQDASGLPSAIPVGGSQVTTIDFSLPGWGSFDVETDGTGSIKSGSILVFSDRGAASKLEGTEVFELFGHFVCVDAVACRNAHQVYVSKNSAESTGVALYNPNKEAVILDVELLSAQGIRAGYTSMTLNPGQQLSCFVTEQALFKSYFDAHPGTFNGTMNIWARDQKPISALGLIQKSGTNALISLPSSSNAHTP